MSYLIEKCRQKYRQIRELLPVVSAMEIRVRAIRNNPLLFPHRRYLDIRLDTNNVCNLTCGFCNVELERKRNPEKPCFLSIEDFKKIADNMFFNARSVHLSCMHEPFMTKHFTEYIKVASQYEIPQLGFVSNGTLIVEKDIVTCVEVGIDKVHISIDGAKPETYKAIRGVDLDKVINVLHLFKEHKKKQKKRLPQIIVNYTLFDVNADELSLFIERFGTLFDQMIVGHYIKRNKELPFNRVPDDVFIRKIEAAGKLCQERGINFRGGYEDRKINKIRRCYNPFHYRNISSKGEVSLCTHEVVGNICEESFLAIEKRNRSKIMGLTYMQSDYCKRCY